jgi:hypothetical protein
VQALVVTGGSEALRWRRSGELVPVPALREWQEWV